MRTVEVKAENDRLYAHYMEDGVRVGFESFGETFLTTLGGQKYFALAQCNWVMNGINECVTTPGAGRQRTEV